MKIKIFKNKDIIVIGGCGSIGSEVVRELLKYKLKRIRIFDNSELSLFNIGQELKQKNVRFLLGDIRNVDRLKRAIKGCDIVINCAAYKHVGICEYNPFESVMVNIVGVKNVIDCCRDLNIKRCLHISTDKVCAPTSVMGISKLLAEKLILNASYGDYKTKFSCVRFGNVLGSSGSVLEVWKKQLEKKKRLTVTSRLMIRYFITKNEASQFILNSIDKMKGREIFIPKLNKIRIYDLAKCFSKRISIIGKRHCEKLDEILWNEEEKEYMEEHKDFFVIKPPIETMNFIQKGRIKKQNKLRFKPKILTKKEIKRKLKLSNLV